MDTGWLLVFNNILNTAIILQQQSED